MPLESYANLVIDTIAYWAVGLFVCFAILEALQKGHGQARNATRERMLTNFGLPVIGSAFSILLVPVSSLTLAATAEAAGVGLFNWFPAPWWVVLPLALLSRTFAGYWLHRANHAWPLLWRIHRVHHSDTHFDLSLSLRQHPLDLIPRMLVFGVAAVVMGLPVWAVALVDLFLIATNYWEHIDGKLPRRVERLLGIVLATPTIHRVHHSALRSQTDSNYGGGLIVWDRLFGTYRDPESNPVERIGLGTADDALADSLAAQLLLPLKAPRPDTAGEETPLADQT